jgi:hypothetical protein
MTSPGPASSDPAGATPLPSSLPPAPWVLLDRTTAIQAATVLDRLEQWLTGAGEPAAVEACAAACSVEEDDGFSVAAWLGALASRLEHRIEETRAGSTPLFMRSVLAEGVGERGTLRLTAVRIGGRLGLRDATLRNPSGPERPTPN